MDSKIHQLEKEAYRSVLAAFKAQSDSLTWEKEGILTGLRKELRLSNDKHIELKARVDSDDHICRIRECRQRGRVGQVGPINRVQDSSSNKREKSVQENRVQDSSSYKREKTVQQISNDVPSQIHTLSVFNEQSPALGTCAWPKVHPRNGGENCRVQDPLVGRRLMTRFPEDHVFFEAVIRHYKSDKDQHGLVYNEGTYKETLKWVNLKEISPDYIRWISKDPPIDISTLDLNTKESMPSTDYEFEILHTETLLQEVEKVCRSSVPNPVLLDKAKEKLKEHEQSLLDVIAKLTFIYDSESSNRNVHR